MRYTYNLTNNITSEIFTWNTLDIGKVPNKMRIDENLETLPPHLTEEQVSHFTHLCNMVNKSTDNIIVGDYTYNIIPVLEDSMDYTKTIYSKKNRVTGNVVTWHTLVEGATSVDGQSMTSDDVAQFTSMGVDGILEEYLIGSTYTITILDKEFRESLSYMQRLQEAAGIKLGKNSIYFNSGSINNYLKGSDTSVVVSQDDHSEYPEVEVIKFKDTFTKDKLVAPSTEYNSDQAKFDTFATGKTLSESRVIDVPANLIPEIDNRIRELKDSMDLFFNNSDTNQSAINSAITVLEQFKVYFKSANEYALHEAQLLLNKLSSQIRDLIPAKTIKYIYTGNFKYSQGINMNKFDIPERNTTNVMEKK